MGHRTVEESEDSLFLRGFIRRGGLRVAGPDVQVGLRRGVGSGVGRRRSLMWVFLGSFSLTKR
jgi:hypothetical protein